MTTTSTTWKKQLQSLRRVKEAIVRGELPMEVVDEKLMRILKLKFQHMKVKAAPLTAEQRRANRAVEEECARRAITLIADPKGNWPVQMDGSVICINATPREAYANMVNIRGIGPNQATPAFDTFQGELARLAPEVKFFASEQLEEALQSATPASTVLVVTEDYPLPGEDFAKEKQQDNVRRIIRECGEKVVVIGLRSAYEFKQYPAGVTYTFLPFPQERVPLCRWRECWSRGAAPRQKSHNLQLTLGWKGELVHRYSAGRGRCHQSI